jgi:hypothetical protein
LDELYGQTASWAKSKGRELRGFSFTVLGTGGGVQRAAPDVRMQLYEEIEHIREYLEESKRLATLEDPEEVAERDYFYGRVSMFRVPPSTRSIRRRCTWLERPSGRSWLLEAS